MSVKLIGKIINSECYQLIRVDAHSTPVWYVDKVTKPLFPGDTGTYTHMGIYDDEATARSEFRLICEVAQQYGRG